MPGYRDQPCNLIIVGASGDLSRRKLLPALFSLYCNGLLPDDYRVIGFSRTAMSDAEFRELVSAKLTCRYEPGADNCAQRMDEFLARCYYVSGQYDEPRSFVNLRLRLRELGSEYANSVFYMAIPPSVFIATAESIGASGMITCDTCDAWSRVVIEKPFGRDSASSRELMTALATIFSERQTYRIDHYLGKEVILNLLILRFANLIFEPIWNRNYIEHVSIRWSETIGCEGRAGYFDHFGIIRDVLQNHLLQIVALTAMEQPISTRAADIADEKVKLLRSIQPLSVPETVVGQYAAATVDGEARPGYLDDPEVPDSSLTPTYARTTLHIRNARWHGVPFYLLAGKALDRSATEICVQFRDVPYSVFQEHNRQLPANKLLIRVQPEEAVTLNIVNKHPGFGFQLDRAGLDLLYHRDFQDQTIPDAYERLLLDVLRGDQSLFLRDDELAVSWELVTPLLHALDTQGGQPTPYPYGSTGPE